MPIINVMKWYKGDDMPLIDVSESMTDKLSAWVKNNFGFSSYPMLVIKGHSYMVSDLVYARIYSLPSQNYRIEFYQQEHVGKPMLVVFPHLDRIHYRYGGQVNKNEELRSSLPTPSYGIVDMGESDLIPLLDKFVCQLMLSGVVYVRLMLI